MPAIERFGPTRRGGPLFRWLGEPLAIDLANTVMVVRPTEAGDLAEDGGDEVDLLHAPADLRHWLSAEGERLAGFEIDEAADLGAVRALREAVRALLGAVTVGRELPPDAIAALNEASAASPAAPRLSVGTGGVARADFAQGGGAAVLLAAVARSAIELLTSIPEGELRICRAPSCGMFYLGARRWCCSACGNRARAARHYRRRRDAPGGRVPGVA